jgi:hypothetical protein
MTLVLLTAILFGIAYIIWRQRKEMATVQDVLDSFTKFQADVKAEVDALEAKLAAGGAIESAGSRRHQGQD